MASINNQPIVETVGENCHIIEISFTVNNYNDIIALDFIYEHKIFCKGFGTEWTVWVIFQRTNPTEPVQALVSLSRTDEEEVIVKMNLSMLLHNVSTFECADILDISTTEIENGWEFKKNFDPLLPSEDSTLLNDGNLEVKFTLTVFDCHDAVMDMKKFV